MCPDEPGSRSGSLCLLGRRLSLVVSSTGSVPHRGESGVLERYVFLRSKCDGLSACRLDSWQQGLHCTQAAPPFFTCATASALTLTGEEKWKNVTSRWRDRSSGEWRSQRTLSSFSCRDRIVKNKIKLKNTKTNKQTQKAAFLRKWYGRLVNGDSYSQLEEKVLVPLNQGAEHS